MPARKKIRKQSKKTVKKSVSKKTSNKRSVKKNVTSRSKSKASSKKAKKTIKKSPKKIASKKSSRTKSKTIKKTSKKVSRPSKRTKTNSTSRKVSTASLDDSKFNMLFEELRSLRANNAELSKRLLDIQSSRLEEQTNISKQITNQFVETKEPSDSKEELMSQLKRLLSKKSKESSEEPIKKDFSDEKTNSSTTANTVINKTLEKQISLKEEKQSTNTFVQEENNPFPSLEKKTLNEKTPFENNFVEQKNPSEEENFHKVITDVDKKDFQANVKRGILTIEEAQDYSIKLKNLQREINKVFIGQEEVVENVIISLVCDAHTLLEGVPGLAKSLLIETFGKTISGTSFERIQFLPDLLPADIIGGQIFNPKTAEFITKKGPIFANFVLADEINRAPPKTHAAVMEAMQEKKINIENEEFILDRPFLVLATQNPLENKGTYQLPEAVLDRFMFKVILDYPKRSDEFKIITDNATTKKNLQRKIKVVLSKKEILEIQQKVKNVFISDKIREYILDLVEATRGVNKNIQGVKFLKYGAGVRASIYLGIAAKARALMEGRNYVLPDDVYHVIPNIFRHRLSLNYKGKAHNISTDKIIEEILKKVSPV